MIKKLEVENPNSCLNRAQLDEPLFVLRANDPLAPKLVREWAEQYLIEKRAQGELTTAHREKYNKALFCAQGMEVWYSLNRPRT